MSEVKKSEPFVYWADCEDPDQSAMCWHKEDALTQINDHGGTLYELSHTSELAAQRLRADMAEAELRTERLRADAAVGDANEAERSLAAAEQRIASITGKAAKCKECGSDALFWFAHNQSTNGIQHGRMTTHDINCVMVLGCAECSATIRTVSADKIAERMTAALNPNPEAESQPVRQRPMHWIRLSDEQKKLIDEGIKKHGIPDDE